MIEGRGHLPQNCLFYLWNSLIKNLLFFDSKNSGFENREIEEVKREYGW